jgi:carboxypeptidase Taq
LDEYSPGVLTAALDPLFKTVSRRLPAMVQESLALQAGALPLPIEGRFAPSRQRALCVEAMKALGFPFERGRLDESEHSFTEGITGDLRVTTHFEPADPFHGLLAALHETGHALYQLGLPPEWRDQPVGRSRGLALEESQSLLLEMCVVRSRPFLTFLKPMIDRHLGGSGPAWEVDNLYRHLTRVHASPLRIDADELTYLAHVLLRCDLERQLISGKLDASDLAEAWNSLAEVRLGIRPDSDAEGVLQDDHWAVGQYAYFPAHALGGLIAMQLWEAIRNEVEDLDGAIARGDFSTLNQWLRTNVHGVGARSDVQALVSDATGHPLSAQPALRYLEAKYLEVR